eukprot:scaffold4745_cov175-Prasinococcus_capsulatus_cf.AAC.1
MHPNNAALHHHHRGGAALGTGKEGRLQCTTHKNAYFSVLGASSDRLGLQSPAGAVTLRDLRRPPLPTVICGGGGYTLRVSYAYCKTCPQRVRFGGNRGRNRARPRSPRGVRRAAHAERGRGACISSGGSILGRVSARLARGPP